MATQREERTIPLRCDMAMHRYPDATALGLDPCYPCPRPIPIEIIRDLVVVYPDYWSLEKRVRTGQMVLHRAIAPLVLWGLSRMCAAHFPIHSIVPIVAYGWDDIRSMQANNSSGWNYRFIAGSVPPRLSLHAYGLAFDINPLWNPCRDGAVWVPDAPYIPDEPGRLSQDSWVVRMFEDMGYTWGGRWQEPFDPQHFQMRLNQI